MEIQILGLRPKKDGTLMTKFHANKWVAPDHNTLFNNLDMYLEAIPENERYNLFYTVNHCFKGGKARQFAENRVYAFDIDGMDMGKIEKYIELTLSVLKVSRETTAINCSGNGLHILIETKERKNNVTFFEVQRDAYRSVCNALDAVFKKNNLPGKADPSVFDQGRIFRLPGTANRKKDKPEVQAYTIQTNIIAVDYSLSHSLGIDTLPTSSETKTEYDYVNLSALSKFPDIDTTAVLSECALFTSAKENPEEVAEPHWKAMMSIFAHMENGNELAHEYSREYSRYNEKETDAKFDRATLHGPMLCGTIEQKYGFDKCKSCIHYKSNTVRTPISIKGESFIATGSTGFRKIKPDGTPGAIQYNDLVKHYHKKVGMHVTDDASRNIYVWSDNYWKKEYNSRIEAFCYDNVIPEAPNSSRKEFLDTLKIMNLQGDEFFSGTENRLNLRNGVLNLKTMELEEHTRKYGFRYIIDYDYDAKAKCPKFDKFMREVTLNDDELIKLLLEYAGYCISDAECYPQKAMVLLGDGSNGKSTFIEIVQMVAGEGNYSSVTLRDLQRDNVRAQIVGKLFNVAEETPIGSMKDSAIFKTLVSGGTSTAKILYQDTFSFKNKTKFLFGANAMPKSVDNSHGLIRRMLIAPFNARFDKANVNRSILKELKEERSGILNKLIEALIRLRTNDWNFTEVGSAQAAQDEYREELDDVRSFCSDMITEDERFDRVSIVQLYDEFQLWLEDNGKKCYINRPEFGKRLRKIFPGLRVGRDTPSNGKVRLYYGIGLSKHVSKLP